MICMVYAYAAIWMSMRAEKQAFADIAPAEELSLAQSSAVVFVYHRIGEDRFQESNLPFEQFEEHVQAMTLEDYNVLPMADMLYAIKEGQTLPERSIVITFEGAYKPTLDAALPLLIAHKIPFTIFLSPERVDWQSDKYLSWAELKKLKKKHKKLISFGLIPGKYDHLAEDHMETYSHMVNYGLGRFREELDIKPAYITYPYGEFTADIQMRVKEYEFDAAFGQQSGVVYEGSDFYALPRFSMTSSFGGLDRFQLTAGSKALPVVLENPYQSLIQDLPEDADIRFSVKKNIPNLDKISCFASSIGKIEVARDGQNIALHIPKTWLADKLRVNCTLPYVTHDHNDATATETVREQWYWLGMLFHPMI